MKLKEFLALPCGEVPDLDLTFLIKEWAIGMGPTEGQLPGISAHYFAAWLDEGWADWTEEEDVPVQKILEGAVAEWCGGRTL